MGKSEHTDYDPRARAIVVGTTKCPRCGGEVQLSGEGHYGDTVRMWGKCPQGDWVYADKKAK